MNQFIEKLEKLLNQYEISSQEKKDIIEDYKQMIEDGKQRGLSEKAISEMIGNPEKITSELGFEKKDLFPGGEKLIALSPFISLIIFLILGITKELWHPGWMVFLLIPVVAIIVELGNSRDKYFLTALSPFLAFAFFFVAGFVYDIWHPTWLIFVIIPLFGIINSKDEMDHLTFYTALSPFISFIAFIMIGYTTGEYQFAWLVLLSVIALGILHEGKTKNKILLFASLALSIVLYLGILIYYENWMIASSAFTIFVITGLLTSTFQLNVNGTISKIDLLIIVISIILFMCVGYLYDFWAISWLFLFIIPMSMIIKYNRESPILTALSPFISIAIFMLLGYFFDLWHVAWMALLLIPIIAIIEEKK